MQSKRGPDSGPLFVSFAELMAGLKHCAGKTSAPRGIAEQYQEMEGRLVDPDIAAGPTAVVFGFPGLLGELGDVAVGGEPGRLVGTLGLQLRFARGLLHNYGSFRNKSEWHKYTSGERRGK